MNRRAFAGASHRLGDRQAARPKTSLNAVAAYRLISPPIDEPAISVFALSGRVRRFASIIGLKSRMNHSIVARPRPRIRPRFGSSQVKGQYSTKRLLPTGLHSTAAMISGVSVLSI